MENQGAFGAGFLLGGGGGWRAEVMPKGKEHLHWVLCLEDRSALEDLFPLDFGIPKPERGHLAFLEKGNPPKRVEGEEFLRAGHLLNREGRVGEREGSRTQSSLLPLGKGLSLACLGWARGGGLHLLRPCRYTHHRTSPKLLISTFTFTGLSKIRSRNRGCWSSRHRTVFWGPGAWGRKEGRGCDLRAIDSGLWCVIWAVTWAFLGYFLTCFYVLHILYPKY